MSQGGEMGEGGRAQGQEAMKVVTRRRKPSGATWAFMCLSLPLALEAPPIHHSTPHRSTITSSSSSPLPVWPPPPPVGPC